MIYQQNQPFYDSPAKMWDSPETVLTVTSSEAKELGLGHVSLNNFIDIATALGFPSATSLKDPQSSFFRASREVARNISKLKRQNKTVSKAEQYLDIKYDQFVELNRETKSPKPPAWNSDRKYSSYYRQSYLERIDRYKKSLLASQNLIQSVADTENKLPTTVASCNDLVVTINEYLGYDRYECLEKTSIKAKLVLDMEQAWDMIRRELKWCKNQE